MRAFACICCVAVLAGCADTQEQPDTAAGDTAGMTPRPDTGAAAARTISLADVAGTWNVRVMREGSDSVLTTYTLMADTDSTWSMKLPNQPDTIPVRVLAVAGDSIVFQAGPYPSVLRRGVTVTTHGVARLENDRLVSRTIARYSVRTADSVMIARTEGTRM
jgi:hypothetical protein